MIEGLADEDGEVSEGEHEQASEGPSSAAASPKLAPAESPAEPSRGRGSGRTQGRRSAAAGRKAEDAANVKEPDEAKTEEVKEGTEKDEGDDAKKQEKTGASSAVSSASAGQQAAGKPSGEKHFKVMGALNLGLSLKLGKIYSASDLRGRCAGSRTKLASLEQFMTKPDKLQLIGGGPAVASSAPAASKAKAAAKAKPVQSVPGLPIARRSLSAVASQGAAERATTPVERSRSRSPERDELAVAVAQRLHTVALGEPSGKRLRTKTMDHKRFMPGQIVWHVDKDTCRMSKVMTVPESPSSPYVIIHLADDEYDHLSAMETELKPFNVKDLPRHLMNRDFRNPSGGADEVAVPDERESPNFEVGQYVWYLGEQRPSWPAKVQRVPGNPEEGEDAYEIQLCGTSDGRGFGESIVVKKTELLRLERRDLRAHYQVAQRLEVVMGEEEEAAATEFLPTQEY